MVERRLMTCALFFLTITAALAVGCGTAQAQTCVSQDGNKYPSVGSAVAFTRDPACKKCWDRQATALGLSADVVYVAFSRCPLSAPDTQGEHEKKSLGEMIAMFLMWSLVMFMLGAYAKNKWGHS